MQFQIKYVIASITGLICAVLLFIVIKGIYYPPNSSRSEIVDMSKQAKRTTSSIKPDVFPSASSTQSNMLDSSEQTPSQQEIEEAIAFLDSLEEKENDESIENQSVPLQPMGIQQRMKAFQQSSKEYQKLKEQNRILVRQLNQLGEEIAQWNREISNTLHEFVAIPSVPPEQTIRNFERQKNQLPPEIVKRWEEKLRIAKEQQDERKALGQHLERLIETRDLLNEKWHSVDQEFSEVNTATIDLFRHHGLPGTRTEFLEAIENEGN